MHLIVSSRSSANLSASNRCVVAAVSTRFSLLLGKRKMGMIIVKSACRTSCSGNYLSYLSTRFHLVKIDLNPLELQIVLVPLPPDYDVEHNVDDEAYEAHSQGGQEVAVTTLPQTSSGQVDILPRI